MHPILTVAVACVCLSSLEASSRQGTSRAPTHSGSISKAQLVRNGKPVDLPYVRAVRFVPVEGPARLHVLFATSRAAEIEFVSSFGEDLAAINRWASEHEETAAVISTTEGQEQNYMVTLAAGASPSIAAGTRTDGELRGAFRQFQVTSDRMIGSIVLDQPAVFSGSFDTALETIRETPYSTGPHVSKSTQAILLVAYARAMRTLDIKAAQVFSASNLEQEFSAARQELGTKYLAQMIAERYGDVAQLERDLASAGASLRESGDMAQIRLTRSVKDSRGEDTRIQTFTFVRLNGVWKIK